MKNVFSTALELLGPNGENLVRDAYYYRVGPRMCILAAIAEAHDPADYQLELPKSLDTANGVAYDIYFKDEPFNLYRDYPTRALDLYGFAAAKAILQRCAEEQA